jgi:positive regulator of sigma E activity
MAYLDSRSSVNGRIVLMTIPAIAYFSLLLMQSAVVADSTSVLVDVESALSFVSRLVWISPLFVLIQASMIVRGLAAASLQNWLCVVLTAVAAFMMWRSSLGL